ncbi:MAG: hypothetical protein JSS55_11515 [Proteobacteria bacterium]|nr:hypothetical protein [Pseudomonadota bacterium]
MDGTYGLNREDYDDDQAGEAPPPVIGGRERRMQVRAYDYWSSLLDGRACPLIQDLDPASIADFGPHSVLLDFSRSIEDPTIAYLGRALRDECGMIQGIRTVSDVPRGSLLSRLTDHYLQILANSAPIGFEAEFVNNAGLPTMYRGILMPFTSDGNAIDYVYGVINWKHGAPAALSDELERQVADVLTLEPLPELLDPFAAQTPEPAFESDASPAAAEVLPELASSADDGLMDALAAARISAEDARESEGRAHGALYAAIGRAYDFALAAEAEPEAYAELLQDEGLKVQARAPMTPIVKLVFGATYDKTRLTEYAAALSFARHQNIGRGEMAEFLTRYPGGLKAIVQAERARRAPAARPDKSERAREALRNRAPQAVIEIETGDSEFVVLLARRIEPGKVAILGPVDDTAFVEKAVRKIAG